MGGALVFYIFVEILLVLFPKLLLNKTDFYCTLILQKIFS